MKTCGNCRNLCTDHDYNERLSFLCSENHMYVPTKQKEDLKFDMIITSSLQSLKQLRIVFYAEVYCKDHLIK